MTLRAAVVISSRETRGGQVGVENGRLRLFALDEVGAVPFAELLSALPPLLRLLGDDGQGAAIVQSRALLDLGVVDDRQEEAEGALADVVALSQRLLQVVG